MATVPTVRVENEDGYKVINESDFDSKTMKMFEGSVPEPPSTESDELLFTASAEALADDYRVDLSDVTGTGAGGNITKKDVQNFIDA